MTTCACVFVSSISSDRVTKNVKMIYLTIIDEMSMAGQRLIGLAETITRLIRNVNETPWAGIHMCFTGDWLQLPPVGAKRLCTPVSDSSNDSYTNAAYR